MAREYEQNQERYRFLKWGQQAFSNFSVVPPGTGICHQVNLEYLAQTVWTSKEKKDGKTVEVAYPDTLVGTDSHTTMVNGLAVLGWGVGGIEAEAAMLGQPLSMLLPEVIGFKLHGELRDGVTATDLVLTVTQMLRKKGVVGKFVEFYGPGLNAMSVADRATLANMAPEYGATCGLFPIDAHTLDYLKSSGRKPSRIALVEAYAKAQGTFRTRADAGPGLHRHARTQPRRGRALARRPQAPAGPRGAHARPRAASSTRWRPSSSSPTRSAQRHKVEGTNYDLGNGDVVIAAITSCTNTSNPSVMLAAGLVARNAVAKGLTVKPWVKTSLAPGSQVVQDYLKEAELQKPLDKLGFNIVGFGCTTCIGNSGPLAPEISASIAKHNLVATSVLSRQPQLRGPRQSGRARQLSRLAPAGRRLRARGLDERRPHPRSARQGQAGQGRLSRRHLAEDRGGASARRFGRSPRKCSRRNTPACSTATRTGARSRRRRASPTPGTWARPMCRTRPISRA